MIYEECYYAPKLNKLKGIGQREVWYRSSTQIYYIHDLNYTVTIYQASTS